MDNVDIVTADNYLVRNDNRIDVESISILDINSIAISHWIVVFARTDIFLMLQYN